MAEPLILRPHKLKTIGLLFGCIIFVRAGFFMINENSFMGWVGIIFFGLGAIVAVIQLIPNSTFLKLTTDGFEIRTLYRTNITSWNDVESFRAGSISTPIFTSFGSFLRKKHKMVFINYNKSHKKYSRGKSLSRALSGSDDALPTLYGMKAEALAELMNKWKNQKK